jgi:HlyD family secretion protein
MLAAMGALLILAAVTVGLSRLKPAAPALSKASVWVDTVKRGSMLREVRGAGALVPVEVRWVPTLSQGRVEKMCVQPGATVQADTVLVELSNPELEQAALDADWQAQAEEAELEKQRVNLESARLTQLSVVASTRHDATQAELEAQADEELAVAGLVPQLVLKRSRAKAEELKARLEIEEKRLAISGDSTKAQLAVQSTKVRQLKAQAALKRSQVDGLRIRSGIDGVLQKLGDKDPLQVGQQLVAGANVARVVDPHRLKAEIKIPETQARDVQIGQFAIVDTRNGVAEGEVARIDPAVQNGTVTIDVSLKTALPKGARPDLSVEGTVRLEHLEDVINVGRPVQGQAETTIQVFKIAQGGREALKVPVKLGRMSVNTVEVLQGLQPGDQVIISDMSQWDAHGRVRLY